MAEIAIVQANESSLSNHPFQTVDRTVQIPSVNLDKVGFEYGGEDDVFVVAKVKLS